MDRYSETQTNLLMFGSGPPANTTGRNSDFYLDLDSYNLYGPKLNDTWPFNHISLYATHTIIVKGIRGIPGLPGPDGGPGPDGERGVNGQNGVSGDVGEEGPPGPPGNQGVQGIPGIQGVKGPIGNQGDNGEPGSQLFSGIFPPNQDIGSNGDYYMQQVFNSGNVYLIFYGPKNNVWPPGIALDAGPQGPPGPQGITGGMGAMGETGVKGVTGPRGNTGVKGVTGGRGPQGIRGLDGPDGIIGEQGPQGSQGEQGVQGMQGVPGLKGFTGPRGSQGDKGETGDQGIPGIRGINGPVGDSPQGDPGLPGVTTLSGSQPPDSNIGLNGDYYIYLSESPELYGPKNNDWSQSVNLTGYQGPQGDNGEPGETVYIYYSESPPSPSFGEIGDLYIQSSDGVNTYIYGPKEVNGWTPNASLEGLAGSDGVVTYSGELPPLIDVFPEIGDYYIQFTSLNNYPATILYGPFNEIQIPDPFLMTGAPGSVSLESQYDQLIMQSSDNAEIVSIYAEDDTLLLNILSDDTTYMSNITTDYITPRPFENPNEATIYVSDNNINNLFKINRVFYDIAVSDDGKHQIVGTSEYIYVSNDYGVTWINRGAFVDLGYPYSKVDISANGQYQIVLLSQLNISISSDYGENWKVISPIALWFSIAISSDGQMIVGVEAGNIHVSLNQGQTWTITNIIGVGNIIDIAICRDDKNIQTVVTGSGFIITTNNAWTNYIVKQSLGIQLRSVAMSSNSLKQTVTSNQFIYVTTDAWDTRSTRMNDTSRNWHDVSMSGDGSKRLATLVFGRVYESLDDGVNWSETTFPTSNLSSAKCDMDTTGNLQTFVAQGTNNQTTLPLYFRYNSIDPFVRYTNTIFFKFKDIAVSSDGTIQIIISTEDSSNIGKLFVSRDRGSTFTSVLDTNAIDLTSVSISPNGLYMTATASNGYIYYSNDIGVTWFPLLNDVPRNWRRAVVSDDGLAIIAITNNELYLLEYSGTWLNIVITQPPSDTYIEMAASDNLSYITIVGQNNIYVWDGIVWSSSPNTNSYKIVSVSPSGQYQAITVNSSSIVPGQILISKDYGITWNLSNNSSMWKSVSVTDTVIIACNGTYLFYSYDYGDNWTSTTVTTISIVTISDNNRTIAGFGPDPNNNVIFYSDVASFFQSILPEKDDSYDIGSLVYRWKNIYATNSVINTSDIRKKTDISDSDLGLEFVKKLRPVKYKFVNNDSDRYHYGLIAQEVETLFQEDVNMIVNYDSTYGLRYYELISPLIKATQDIDNSVNENNFRIDAIKIKSDELARILNSN